MKSPVRSCLPINYQNYLLPLVTLAVLVLLAPPAFAQTYTITDLNTLGTNSLGTYSQAFCLNASGQVAGESSASSSQRSDPAFLYSNGQLITSIPWAATRTTPMASITSELSPVIPTTPRATSLA